VGVGVELNGVFRVDSVVAEETAAYKKGKATAEAFIKKCKGVGVTHPDNACCKKYRLFPLEAKTIRQGVIPPRPGSLRGAA
jgi:hypothetical protein